MSFILLGILNSQAAGAPAGAGSYDLLETTVLGSDTASVSFSSLDSTYGSTYKHLQVRIVARGTRTAFNRDDIFYRFNSDTSSAYVAHSLSGDGASVASVANTGFNRAFMGSVSTNGDSANIFSPLVTDILDFAETKNKTTKSFGGRIGSSPVGVSLRSGLYVNTGTINSITFALENGDFVTGSRFSLYGIKAA